MVDINYGDLLTTSRDDEPKCHIFVHSGVSNTVTGSFVAPLPYGLTWNIALDLEGNAILSEQNWIVFLSGISATATGSYICSEYGAVYCTGITVADNGDMWTCDSNKNFIYHHSGLSSTLIGSFASPGANPFGVTISSEGNLISSDNTTDHIYQHDGMTSSLLGSFASPSSVPYGLDIDLDGNLLSGDDDTSHVYVHSGISATLTGSFAGPTTSVNGVAVYKYKEVLVTVSSAAATDVSTYSVTLNGELTDASEQTLSLCFRYKEQGGAWEDDIEVETGITSPQTYDYNLTGLDPDTTYEFQAVAKYSATEVVGSTLEFTTAALPVYEPVYTKITVDGTIYADAIKINVDKTIGEFNATSNFSAEFNNFNGKYSDTFNLNDEVIVYADRGTNPPTTKLFTGVIEDIKFRGNTEKEKVTIVGRDYGAVLLDMTVQPIIFKNDDAGVIARQIVLNNTNELLTTTNVNIATGTTIERIGFNHVDVFSALQELAELSGCYFYVDNDKDVHFELKSSTSSGETFNNDNVTSATFKEDDREIFNKVFVYGARTLTGANDVGGTWATGATGSVFDLSYKPHNTAVSVDGILQQPAGIYEMTNPATETDLKYVVDFSNKKIIFVSGAAAGDNIPASGTSNVSVDYQRFTPLLKYLDDDTSIAAYGPKTKIIKDDNLKGYTEVSNRATTFLADNKNPKIQGDIDSRRIINITPGNTCIVNLPWHGISNQTYTILSASYIFNPIKNLNDNVLHITVNKKLSDFTDVMKAQMVKLNRFEVGPLEGEYTNLKTVTEKTDVQTHYEVWQRNINTNFVFHSGKHGLIQDLNSRIGTGQLGSTFIVSGGGF